MPETLPDTDGNAVAVVDADAPASVVVFTCNHCPYALAWHERLNAVARDYGPRGVHVVQVNANDAERYPRDSLDAMRERVAGGEFATPYLHDATQELARDWDAKVTPDVYVVAPDGAVLYRGAPDADYQDESRNAQWLRDALDDVLAGRPVRVPATEPKGCSIKWRQ
ncbi:MAG TPA: thioredoxin family protein [Solirubrobacteraceae bacterium]